MEYKDISKGSGEVKTEYKEFVALHSRIIAANNEVTSCRWYTLYFQLCTHLSQFV